MKGVYIGVQKKGQAILIAPLQPPTLAVFRPWGIWRELAVRDLPLCKGIEDCFPRVIFVSMKLNSDIDMHALLGAFMVLVINLVGYIMGAEAMTGAWVGGGGFLVLLAAMIVGCIAVRKDEGGTLSYGRAWCHIMLVWLITAVVIALYNTLLYTVLDPGIVGPLVEITVDRTEEMMNLLGARLIPESEVEMLLADTRESTRSMFTASGQLLGLLWSGVFWAILALLVALTVRRREVRDFN